MTEAEFHRLLDLARRRPLSEEEERVLRIHLEQDPSARVAWENDAGLTRLLSQLPDAPLASNFTAQVLRAVERETTDARRTSRFPWIVLRRPFHRCVAACVMLALLALAHSRYQDFSRRNMATALASVARNVTAPAVVTELPPVELWRDFHAIDLVGRIEPQADEELLTGLALK